MRNLPTRPGADADWDALLRQLRQQAPAQPRPFFYARVQARLAARQRAESTWLPGWARRPAYVALLGALVLVVSGDGAALRPVPAAYPTLLPGHVATPLPR